MAIVQKTSQTTSHGSPLEKFSGLIERVTFHSPESGFCVLKVKAKGHLEEVAVVGQVAKVHAGEYMEAQGHWHQDKVHGLQFKAQTLQLLAPTTPAGIEKYLGSGMIKGIGPHYARLLVKAFGEDVFTIMDQQPERLLNVPGIGQKKVDGIMSAWKEQRSIRDIMVFLQSHGVGTARAVRIYKYYGERAIKSITANPYCLARDIHGMGFKTADDLAQRLGVALDADIRACAGMIYALEKLCEEGHTLVACDRLIEQAEALLEIPKGIIEKALDSECKADRLKQQFKENQPCVALAPLYYAERQIAAQLKRLFQGSPPWGSIEAGKAVAWVEQKTRFSLSASQKKAVETVLSSKVSVITGGPGVGKTTVVRSIIEIVNAKKQQIALCAPTGRAAKRLQESTGMVAKTIHRLLEFDPITFKFKRHDQDPLPIDFLVVDESSMIDTILMSQLLKAIPSHAALLLVGDKDQLPSVGSGQVLSDVMGSGVIPVVTLTEIFRQAASSQIIVNAHRINEGKMPFSPEKTEKLETSELSRLSTSSEEKLSKEKLSDFYVSYVDTPEELCEQVIELVAKRIPKRFNVDPIKSIQVLSPMHRGVVGSQHLNARLQALLNGQTQPRLERYGTTFAPCDKVMQLRNNYTKEVFNGDMGVIRSIDLEASMVVVDFDSREVCYEFHELDEISLAYAVSIHKSQGSEYPVVVIPLAMQHYNLLARNLVYTGVTRGKSLVVLVAQKKALAMAVHKAGSQHRLTYLKERLVEDFSSLALGC